MRHATRATRRAVLAAAAAWALAAAGAAPPVSAAGAASDRQTRTFAARADQTWTVTADLATVRVVGDPARRDVRIDVTRQTPAAADLARLPLVMRDGAAGPEVIVRQADGAFDPALRADITVAVPATGSHGAVTIVEGGLDVRAFEGRLDATVARGGITAADVAGALRLDATIGNVAVTGARLTPGGVLRLRAFNGDVRLGLAAWPRDARVMALALNGSIESAVPLTMKDGWGPRWGEATFGTGAHVVSIDVVTGRVRIDAPAAR